MSEINSMSGNSDENTVQDSTETRLESSEVVHGIKIDRKRDALITQFGQAMMNKNYLLPGESFQDRFACVASAYGDDQAHSQRIYDYISKLWFMPATPVLSNGGTKRGLSISCYLSEMDDSLAGIVEHWNENIWLASKGGGLGCVDSKTEFLTPLGWKKISDYKDGDLVMVSDAQGNKGWIEKPKRYISGPCQKMYKFNGVYSEMVVSENHRHMVKFDGDKKFSEMTTAQLLENNLYKEAKFKPSISCKGGSSLHYTSSELKGLITSIINRNTSNVLLEKDALNFSNFGNASKEQMSIIFDEILYPDGNFDYDNSNLKFSSMRADEIDFIQYVVMSVTGHRCDISEKSTDGSFIVTQTSDSVVMFSNVEEFVPEDGKQYCFETSTSFWLSRRNGKVLVTGNSYWGNLRGLGENVGINGKTSGVIPFIKVMDSLTLAISQGCVDGQTEILTQKGWIRFDSLNSNHGCVMQVDAEGAMTFVNVAEYHKYPYSGTMHHYKNASGTLDHFVTPNHKMVVYSDNKITTCESKDLILDKKNKFLEHGSINKGSEISFIDNSEVERIDVENWSGNVYCVSVPSGMFLSRRNEKSIVTGNSLRRGSAAVYLPIDHPEIEEFIEMRRPTGGDPNRKTLNLHHGVVVSDKFMLSVQNDEKWDLISPHSKLVMATVSARALWIRLITARIETGEPYLVFSGAVQKALPESYKLNNLSVKMSNLCSEILLTTGLDHLGKHRTAVCCLSSLNLDNWDEWNTEPQFIEDVMRFLDNVLQQYIDYAPETMNRAKYSAMRERSVGLGAMGFHSFLQKKSIPFESPMAQVWNKKIFKHIKEYADRASVKLAHEKGACPDAKEHNIFERFSNKIAIAPTASISVICGQASPGIDPYSANSYTEKRTLGSVEVRNAHLCKVLEKYGKNDEDTWSSITTSLGSVQHLSFLTDGERAVFKTAFEMDQRAIIQLASDRTPYVCQSQSVNLFLPADVHKRDLNQIHTLAWKLGLKSLYYCRSLSIQRAQNVSDDKKGANNASQTFNKPKPEADLTYEVCEACQ